MASVAALPAYVMMRASVARVLELVPVSASRDAIELLGARSRRMARVRRRLLAAVVAPVAFVALGASLLVHAHLRAFDTSSRQSDAAEIAQGVLDSVEGDVRGRKAAIDAARAYGFDIDVSRSAGLFSATRTDEGKTVLTVPSSPTVMRLRDSIRPALAPVHDRVRRLRARGHCDRGDAWLENGASLRGRRGACRA